MLPAYIIEEIVRRRERRLPDSAPAIELPVPEPIPYPDHGSEDRPDDSSPTKGNRDRGVAVIDYFS